MAATPSLGGVCCFARVARGLLHDPCGSCTLTHALFHFIASGTAKDVLHIDSSRLASVNAGPRRHSVQQESSFDHSTLGVVDDGSVTEYAGDSSIYF